jgi:Na+/alanine symporter
MNQLIIIAISYFLTGVWRIRQDFKQSYTNRPAYARNPSRYLTGFTLIILTWPIIVYHEVRIHKSIGKAVPFIIVFGALLAFGFWLDV